MSVKWDLRFLELARHVAGWSKDPSTKVGAVIVNDARIVVGLGYNGFPRGVSDALELMSDRPTKYARAVHAEANAILNASGPVSGGTIYVTHAPCSGCTSLVLQAGIKRVVHPQMPPEFVARWAESFTHSRTMMAEADVSLHEIIGARPYYVPCCVCNADVDTRELEDGGNPDGSQLFDNRWVCSRSCWERATGL